MQPSHIGSFIYGDKVDKKVFASERSHHRLFVFLAVLKSTKFEILMRVRPVFKDNVLTISIYIREQLEFQEAFEG